MHARDIVVFLGPSLPVDEARRILPARYLRPAQCGDVLRARRLSPKVIAIVDGVFASTPSVWHKEILLAIDDGIAVVGASSMGALRAAELAPFGMIGIGRIFDAYRDG
ncbi:MAG TPA: TfuA-like protein, partial [Vicinamibacterales bacterium]|nr:TfuA-like protein [Vicinamibacterales bacterium]